jgi:hypothetical protein
VARGPRPSSASSSRRRRASASGRRAISSGIITFSSAVNSGSRLVELEHEAERAVSEDAQPRLA